MAQSSAQASSDFLGTVNFGSRGGGNTWIVVAIVGAVVVLWLLIAHKGRH